MRYAEWRLSARLVVVSSLLFLMAEPHAIARIGKCSMGSLTSTEKSLLLEAARRVLPPQSEPVVSNLCSTTSAEITTQKIPDQPVHNDTRQRDLCCLTRSCSQTIAKLELVFPSLSQIGRVLGTRVGWRWLLEPFF